jgi:hypothetical protein
VIRASTARSHPSERPQLPPREARASHPSDTPTPAIVRSFVVWMLASQRPLWRLAKQRGLLRTAPVAIAFLATCLAVSGSWATSGLGHRLVADCCAYRGWHPGLGPSVRLAGSAFLLRHQYEVIWTIVATLLVTAPFEALMGSRRTLAVMAVGHLLPTVAIAVAGLAQSQRLGGGGLDVGASAVVVATATGLAVRGRSTAVAAWIGIAQFVGILVQSPLATTEHLIALSAGATTTLLLSDRPSGRTRARSGRPSSPARPAHGNRSRECEDPVA